MSIQSYFIINVDLKEISRNMLDNMNLHLPLNKALVFPLKLIVYVNVI